MENNEKVNKEPFWLSNTVSYFRGFETKKDEHGEDVFDKFLDDFYEDDQIILNADEKSIGSTEFTKAIKTEVSKFINQSFDNIVVLVGAGASITNNDFKRDSEGINISGVTVAKIAEEVDKKLDNETYKLGNKTKNVFKLNEIIEKVQYGYKINDAAFNLEDLISLIVAYEKFIKDEDEREKFKNTKEAIFDLIIKATSYDYSDDEFKHIEFLNFLSTLVKSEHKLNLVTTNYDTLLEDAADIMGFTVIDGFSFSQTPKFNSSMFDWNIIKDVPNVKTHQNIYMENVINLLKIHGSLTWERSSTGEYVFRKNKRNVNKPIMVFPSSNKYAQSYEDPYFELFAKFQELLKRPNTLFITTGFSFADNHISKMILSAIQANDGLATLVTDFSIDASNENSKKLVKEMKKYYRIAFLKATLNDDLSSYLRGYENDD